jgi:hypothetical protein
MILRPLATMLLRCANLHCQRYHFVMDTTSIITIVHVIVVSASTALDDWVVSGSVQVEVT